MSKKHYSLQAKHFNNQWYDVVGFAWVNKSFAEGGLWYAKSLAGRKHALRIIVAETGEQIAYDAPRTGMHTASQAEGAGDSELLAAYEKALTRAVNLPKGQLPHGDGYSTKMMGDDAVVMLEQKT